jgi:Arc/MetJ family transcription regulator
MGPFSEEVAFSGKWRWMATQPFNVYNGHGRYTFEIDVRTNIEIDDALLAEAMAATGLPTKRATIEEALRTLVRLRDDLALMRRCGSLASTGTHHTRTNVDIDTDLLAAATQAAGRCSKRAAIDEGLKIVVRLYRQRQAAEALQGIGWEGDLDEMRRGWSAGESE